MGNTKSMDFKMQNSQEKNLDSQFWVSSAPEWILTQANLQHQHFNLCMCFVVGEGWESGICLLFGSHDIWLAQNKMHVIDAENTRQDNSERCFDLIVWYE